ncbi:unnamed protein product, partial [Didymodactylos carnosus]
DKGYRDSRGGDYYRGGSGSFEINRGTSYRDRDERGRDTIRDENVPPRDYYRGNDNRSQIIRDDQSGGGKNNSQTSGRGGYGNTAIREDSRNSIREEASDRGSGGIGDRTNSSVRGEGDDSSVEDPNERRDRLSPIKDEGYGHLRCSVRFDRSRSKLIVRVHEAKDLINTDRNSLSDPYVRILLLPDKRKKTKRRTKVIKDSLQPVWDEAFEYDLTLEEARMKTVDLTVKNDRSLFSTEKVFMGQALITLGNLNLDDENLIDQWYTLEPEGALALRLKGLDAENLTARWVPSTQTAGVYEWTGESNKKSKTMTYFGTGEMRGQLISSQPSSSSSYTDAYLSAFAPKHTHKKHHHSSTVETSSFSLNNNRPVSSPVTTPQTQIESVLKNNFEYTSSRPSSSVTSPPLYKQVHFVEPNVSYSSDFKTQPSTFGERPVYSTDNSFSSSIKDNYGSMTKTTYPSSKTPYPSSNSNQSTGNLPQSKSMYNYEPIPQSNTYLSSYSTSVQPPSSSNLSSNYQTSYLSTYNSSPISSPSTFPKYSTSTSYVSQYPTSNSYLSIFKPLPAYTSRDYSSRTTYPSNYESTPPLPPSNISRYDSRISSNINENDSRTYSPHIPTSAYSTNLFQHSTQQATISPKTTRIYENIEQPTTSSYFPQVTVSNVSQNISDRPVHIDNESPKAATPLLESPTQDKLVMKPEQLDMEETVDINQTVSKPIEILETTLNKYDSLIDQISAVLASVSPITSTISSMSPGKSLLDYELSSDSSPTTSKKSSMQQKPDQVKTPIDSEDEMVKSVIFVGDEDQPSKLQKEKDSYLITGSSYDKLVTAISAMDSELKNRVSEHTDDDEKVTTSQIFDIGETDEESSSDNNRISTAIHDMSETDYSALDQQPVPNDTPVPKEKSTLSDTDSKVDDIQQGTSSLEEILSHVLRTGPKKVQAISQEIPSQHDEQLPISTEKTVEDVSRTEVVKEQTDILPAVLEEKMATLDTQLPNLSKDNETIIETPLVAQNIIPPNDLASHKEEIVTTSEPIEKSIDTYEPQIFPDDGRLIDNNTTAENKFEPEHLTAEISKKSSANEQQIFDEQSQQVEHHKESSHSTANDESLTAKKSPITTQTYEAPESSPEVQTTLETQHQTVQETDTTPQTLEETSLPEVSQTMPQLNDIDVQPIVRQEDDNFIQTEELSSISDQKSINNNLEETSRDASADIKIEQNDTLSTNITETKQNEELLNNALNLETMPQLNDIDVQPIVRQEDDNFIQTEELSSIRDQKSVNNLSVIIDEILHQAVEIISHENQNSDKKFTPDEISQLDTSSSDKLILDKSSAEISQDLTYASVESFQQAQTEQSSGDQKPEEQQPAFVPDNEEERNKLPDIAANESPYSPPATESEQLQTNETAVDTIQDKPTSTVPIEENLERGILSEEDSFYDVPSQKSEMTVTSSSEIFTEPKVEYSITEEKINLPQVSQLTLNNFSEEVRKSESAVPEVIHTEDTIGSSINNIQSTESEVREHEIKEATGTRSNEINLHVTSPLEELNQTSQVSTRYLSSDVYYAYLGDHYEPDVVNKMTDDDSATFVRDDTVKIAVDVVNGPKETQSTDETLKTEVLVSEGHTAEQLPLDNKTESDTIREPTVLETIAQTVTAPFTAISETVQKVVANLQSSSETQSITDNILEDSTITKSDTELEEKKIPSLDEQNEKNSEAQDVESQSDQHGFFDTVKHIIASPVVAVTEVVQNIVSSIQHSSNAEPDINKEQSFNQEDQISSSIPSTQSEEDQKVDQSEELPKLHGSDADVRTDQLEPDSEISLQESTIQRDFIHEIPSIPELISTNQDNKLQQDHLSEDSLPRLNESSQPFLSTLDDVSQIREESQPKVEEVSADLYTQQLQENSVNNQPPLSQDLSADEAIQISSPVIGESRNVVSTESQVETANDSPLVSSDVQIPSSNQLNEDIDISSNRFLEDNKTIDRKDTGQEETLLTIPSESNFADIEQTIVSEQHQTTDSTAHAPLLDTHIESSNSIDNEQLKSSEINGTIAKREEKQAEQSVEGFQPSSESTNKAIIDGEPEQQPQIQVQESTHIQQLLEEMVDVINSENDKSIGEQPITDTSSILDQKTPVLNVTSEETASLDALPSISQEKRNNELNPSGENFEDLHNKYLDSSVNMTSTHQNDYSREYSPAITETDTFDLLNTLKGHSIMLNSGQTGSNQVTTIDDLKKFAEISSTDTSDDKSPPVAPFTVDSAVQADSTERLSTRISSSKVISYGIHDLSDAEYEKLSEMDIKKDLPALIYDQTTTVEQQPTEGQKITTDSDRSSTTTSASQITSSDRYVSYAIHELGDSSVEQLSAAIPINADLPIFKNTNSDTSAQADAQIKEQDVSDMVNLPVIGQQQPAPSKNKHQHQHDMDDATEFDATENITYSPNVDDENLASDQIKKISKKQHGSSTDEDADEDIMENVDNSEQNLRQQGHENIYRIVREIASYSPDEAYRRYDTSSRDSSSAPAQTDDVFLIPGFPGLWRGPDKDSSTQEEQSSFDDDADDEKYSMDDLRDDTRKKTTIKTKTIVRTADPSKFQSLFHQEGELNIPLRPVQHTTEAFDIFNRPLNDFAFDPCSESDSFKTALETEASQMSSRAQALLEAEEQRDYIHLTNDVSDRTSSPVIIRGERGVSLPVATNISYDDLDFRLSTSSPIETPSYSETNKVNSLFLSNTQVNDVSNTGAISDDNNALKSTIHESSPYSEIQTTSSGGSSKSLSSGDEQRIYEKRPWWKAVNTEDESSAAAGRE